MSISFEVMDGRRESAVRSFPPVPPIKVNLFELARESAVRISIRCPDCGREITLTVFRFRGIVNLDHIVQDCLCARDKYELQRFINSNEFNDAVTEEYNKQFRNKMESLNNER